MTKTVHLNGNHAAEPTIVELFDRQYRLRPITRSVQKQLEEIEKRIQEVGADTDADGDQVVDVMTDGIDALLAIEGSHRTSAKKALMAKWNADELSIHELEGYFDTLQEAAVVRPT